MLTAHAILPIIRKYTSDLSPIVTTNSMWQQLEYEMIRLALRSAELELKGVLFNESLQLDRNDQLLLEIQTAILAEANRLYGIQA